MAGGSMTSWSAAFVASGAVYIAGDLSWITVTAPTLYRPVIGPLMAQTMDVRAGVAFYLIYIVGILAFGVASGLRACAWTRALASGALFGLVAYATYDLTNQATLRVWSTQISVIDIAWGAGITALASTAGYLAAARLSTKAA